MRNHFRRLSLTVFVALVTLLLVPRSFGQKVHQPTPKQEQSLNAFLQDYLRDAFLGDGKTTNYFSAFVDLNDSGGQVFVYLADQQWCGSGGCTLLILATEGSSYRTVTRITIVRPPICLLATKSNGWYDISVGVQGGGIQPGYEAKLSFDGKTYPRNPSVPPAQRLTQGSAGKIIMSKADLEKPGTSVGQFHDH